MRIDWFKICENQQKNWFNSFFKEIFFKESIQFLKCYVTIGTRGSRKINKKKKQPNIGKDYGCSGKEGSLWGGSQTQDPNS